MPRVRVVMVAAALALGAGAALVPGAAVSAANRNANAPATATPCPPAVQGHATCLARVVQSQSSPGVASGSRASGAAGPDAGAGPSGFSPVAITTAYGFSGTNGGAGETIALVDAYDDPTIAANLSSFSTQFGLPACTTTNGCFTKVNQTGGTTYPAATSGWDLEISLDVEWAHALAPDAHVLLVEASSTSYTNLFRAVTYAAQHAQYVSMSWGGTEFSGETSLDADFAATPNVSFFAASGDTAAEVIYPSSSPDVLSVGGTTLSVTPSTDAWKSETAWSSAGGGCSRVENATAAQKAFPTYDQVGATCAGRRATPDLSLDANPASGVSVYDSKRLSTGLVGWITVGGTSASTAMVAAHSAASGAHVNASYVYGANIPFYNVVSGSNGHPCEKGYSLCAGLGSWNTKVGTVNGAISGSLSFASAPQALTAGSPSAAVTVDLSAPAPSTGVSVKLTTSSAGGMFSAARTSGYAHTLTVTVGSGAQTATVYYEDTVAGSPVLTATASGWSSATQTESVAPASLASITVAPASVTLGTGATQTFTASGKDAYGNSVTTGFAPTWTTSTGGSLSPGTGTTTTLTAPKSAVTKASVTATQGSVAGSATVTVVATPALKAKVTAGTVTVHGPNYQVPLTVTATGTSGGVAGASVTLDVYRTTCTGTLVAAGSSKTGPNGTVGFTFTTGSTGTYCVKATVTATGYSAATATVTFSITAPRVGLRLGHQNSAARATVVA